MKGGKACILNRFFVDKTFRNAINSHKDDTYDAVVRHYLTLSSTEITNQEIIEKVYATLKNEYRNEYFYKNTILNKLLLHIHSVRTTTALRELPIGSSKADFVLINGKAVVYEIKTELDNFERLEEQVANYYKAFDHVVVVTSIDNEKNIKNFKKIPDTVGIYLLQKNGYFKRVREPVRNNSRIDSNILFKMMRKKEYISIINDYYGYIPVSNQFELYKKCKKLFNNIPLSYLYPRVLFILKQRIQVNEEQFINVPYELKFLVYFMDFKQRDYLRLFSFLNNSYGGR